MAKRDEIISNIYNFNFPFFSKPVVVTKESAHMLYADQLRLSLL